jgi:hypothetical protein
MTIFSHLIEETLVSKKTQNTTDHFKQMLEGEHRLAYQVILRHLARFRDGALALLRILNGRETQGEPDATVAVVSEPAVEKSPLEARIERHMGLVDRALDQIRTVNPERKKKDELSPEQRDEVRKHEATLRAIVCSELHYWSATIEHNPLEKFDPMEQSWIRRIIRLGDLLGVDQDHQEHLTFLHDWASHEHH